MAQDLKIKLAGLYTFPSDLSAVPPGALTQADEVFLDQDSVAEPRRGFDYLAHGASVKSEFSDPTYRANKLFFYQGQTLCHYAANHLARHDATLGYVDYAGTYLPPSVTPTANTTDGSATVTSLSSTIGLVVGQEVFGAGFPFGTYLQSFTATTATMTQPATATASSVSLTFVKARMRSAQANQNLYFTTSTGVKKLDSVSGTPMDIGAPPGLDAQSAITASKTPTATTVISSAVLTAVSSVTGLAIGMAASGTGIPANTLVVSFTATTVTLSNAATASGSGITITFAAPATFLPASYTTAYRITWGITDANNNRQDGAPSNISQITNTTAAACAVNVSFSIPAAVTTSHFFEIYRSEDVVAGATPSDEGRLVYVGTPLAADLTAGYITVCDIVPESLRGATIYTAASQDGLALQNAAPPLAQDLAVFRNCLFYANTESLQAFDLNLLAVGTPTGIQAGDTLTIGGVVYTADSAENTATGHFLVTNAFLLVTTGTTNTSTSLTSVGSTTGVTVGMAVSGTNIPTGTFVTAIVGTTITLSQAATGSAVAQAITFTGDSAAQAIRDTALSLVKVVNRYASSTVYASYNSVTTGFPGVLQFYSRTKGAPAFAVTASRSTCWSPALPSSGTTQSSTNDVQRNAIYWSKQDEPEAVPLGNNALVGSADKAMLRITALRDSLIIQKEDGNFILTGTGPTDFIVRPLDLTSILIAPETVAVLNNQIMCLTTQGVVAISEIGEPIVSHPIEGDLTALNSEDYPLLQTASFGVSYESSRAYYLSCPTRAGDTGPTQHWRYNYVTNNWTHSTLAKRCGGVNPADDRLYFGSTAMPIVDVERKDLRYSDYADYQSTQTISAVAGRVVSITESDTIAVGSIIYQSRTVFGTVESVDTFAGTVTTTLATDLAAGTADVLAPIHAVITWAPVTFDNPGFSKQIREATLLFLAEFYGEATVGFSTDINPGVYEEPVAGGAVGGWGLFAWGGGADVAAGGALNVLGVPWGGDPRRRPVRVTVSRNHQRCSLLTITFDHAFAYSHWKLQGISLVGSVISERVAQ